MTQRASFTDDEIKVMMFIVRGLNRGADVSMVVRHPAWASLSRKLQQMEIKGAAPAAQVAPEVVERQKYLDQGYTDKEVDEIMRLAK